jgi:hypothetical protein
MADVIKFIPRAGVVRAKTAEPRPAQVKKTVRKKTVRPPTPTYRDKLVIDGDGKRYPSTAYRESVAALVLAELLKRDDIRIGKSPFGLYRKRQQWKFMTDRMIAAAIRDTVTIVFCKDGRRHMAGRHYGPQDWLASAVRFAVFDRPRKRRAP